MVLRTETQLGQDLNGGGEGRRRRAVRYEEAQKKRNVGHSGTPIPLYTFLFLHSTAQGNAEVIWPSVAYTFRHPLRARSMRDAIAWTSISSNRVRLVQRYQEAGRREGKYSLACVHFQGKIPRDICSFPKPWRRS